MEFASKSDRIFALFIGRSISVGSHNEDIKITRCPRGASNGDHMRYFRGILGGNLILNVCEIGGR